MGFFDRVKQTIGQAGNWVKQTAGNVSNGVKWLNENIVQPGIQAGKAIGGDIGKFAENIETGAAAVNDLNEKYRSGNATLGDVVKTGKGVKESYERGRESAGGAKKQVFNEYNKTKDIIKNRDIKSGLELAKKAKETLGRVGGAVKRVRVR